MSPARRLLLTAVVLVVGIVAVVALLARVLQSPPPAVAGAPQDSPGPVLLVPGYGGATGALEVLAAALREAGRTATVVALPGDGRGDLREAATALDAAAAAAGAPVDVIGYSAGGVVARLWARDNPGDVRRVVTLGSPHHGTQVAAIGIALAPGACPVACQQLVPDSPLLEELNDGDETPDGPQWLALWTVQDETVTPPDSARLDGAVNVELQDVCPGVAVSHAQLPRVAVVRNVVLQAIGTDDVRAPGPEVCG